MKKLLLFVISCFVLIFGLTACSQNDAHGHTHSAKPVAAIAAKCTEDGNSAYYVCDCGKWFSDANATTEITDHDSVVIPKLDHDPQSHAAKAPTCSEVGWDAYETCKRDGCDYTTKVEKPTSAHDYWQSVCRVCHAIDPNATDAAGVQYAEVKENGQTVGYSVSRVSNYGYRRIPSEHDGLPVVSIGDNAFNNNRTMVTVEIPSSVKSIGAGAFADCGNLNRITFGGTKAEWNAITKGADWDSNTGDYTVYCSDGTVTKA